MLTQLSLHKREYESPISMNHILFILRYKSYSKFIIQSLASESELNIQDFFSTGDAVSRYKSA